MTKTDVENIAAETLGVMLGRFIKFVIVIAGCAGLLSQCLEAGREAEAKAKPAATAKVSKPTKRNYKKYHSAKIVVDEPRKIDYKNFIGPRD